LIVLVLTLIALVMAIPSFALLTLTIAAVLPRSFDSGIRQVDQIDEKTALTAGAGGASPSIAVLVPAYNESRHVLPTIACLLAQVGKQGRVVVIADNCTDDTAAQARQTEAIVIERSNPAQQGKGFALAYGVDYLRDDPPDVVIVIDADCFVTEGGIQALAAVCSRTGQPVQIPSLMQAGGSASLRTRILEFAMLMKNYVRPMGSSRLGQVCHLMGTGMALPWTLISQAKLATSNIVEDMVLGIEFAMSGHPVRFLPEYKVISTFMEDYSIVHAQKSRWEHGHLQAMAGYLPNLIVMALRRPNSALAFLAIDLCIPPVALYFLLLCGGLTGSLLLAWFWPETYGLAIVTVLSALCFVTAISIGWYVFGRRIISAGELMTTPLYALWKLPIYIDFCLKKRSHWVRTKREDE
jgi:glycosyltransferase involved in cell wall biosynthesis